MMTTVGGKVYDRKKKGRSSFGHAGGTSNLIAESALVFVGSNVARWHNWIPSFPWIGPGWRAGQSKEKKGSHFAAQRSRAIVLQT